MLIHILSEYTIKDNKKYYDINRLLNLLDETARYNEYKKYVEVLGKNDENEIKEFINQGSLFKIIVNSESEVSKDIKTELAKILSENTTFEKRQNEYTIELNTKNYDLLSSYQKLQMGKLYEMEKEYEMKKEEHRHIEVMRDRDIMMREKDIILKDKELEIKKVELEILKTSK